MAALVFTRRLNFEIVGHVFYLREHLEEDKKMRQVVRMMHESEIVYCDG